MLFSYRRLIWNVKSTKNLTFYLIPDGKDESHENVFKIPMNEQLGDSNPEKIKDVGDHTLKVKDDEGRDLLNQPGFKLKLGASYEFLVQVEDVEDGTDLITVKTSCKILY